MEPCRTQTPSRGNRAENWRRRAAQGLDQRGTSKDFPGGLLLLLLLLSRFSRVQLRATPQTAAHRLPHPWDSPGKNTGVGCHCLLRPGGLVVKNSPCKAGDTGSIPDWGAKIPYAVE